MQLEYLKVKQKINDKVRDDKLCQLKINLRAI